MLFKQTPIPAKVTFYTISRAFVSCLGCQHFISDWLGKLKPNKLSTGCQNELKGAAVEKAMNPGRRFLFFSRLRRSFSRASRANFAATPLLRPARQNRHATQAITQQKLKGFVNGESLRFLRRKINKLFQSYYRGQPLVRNFKTRALFLGGYPGQKVDNIL